MVQTLLGYGPFAGAVGPVLQSLETLDAVFDLVNGRLAENNLTLSRITGDISAAWDEMDLAVLDHGPNVAIAQRYINAVIADVRAFVSAIVADVLALIKEAAVDFVEPLVQTPEIKPYWDLGTKVFHYDPLRGAEVSAPTVEILTDFLTLIGKEAAVAQMSETAPSSRPPTGWTPNSPPSATCSARPPRSSPTPGRRSNRRTCPT